MRIKLLICFIMLMTYPVFAQDRENKQLPPDQLAMRTELENDKSILTIGCGLFYEIDLNRPSTEQSLKIQKEAIKTRIKLYRASKKRDKTIKAKASCKSDEGDRIVHYLIIDKGKTRYIGDYSRDPFGGLRIIVDDCSELSIGYFAPTGTFISLKEKDFDKKILVLKCISGNRELFF